MLQWLQVHVYLTGYTACTNCEVYTSVSLVWLQNTSMKYDQTSIFY